MMAEPKLTVCVPVYNGEKTIGRLLKSLTAQTMDDIRILVSDNASTDETGRICRNLASRDSRIIYSCNPENLGLNFNFCHVSFAHNSPYTAYAAHDLIWKPQFAEKLILVLENNPDALIAYPCCEFIDSDRETEELYFDKVRFDEPDPESRYLNIIKYLGWNTPFLGIMRHFKASPLWLQLLYAYNEDFSGDNLHIAAIALMGKIKQLHLPLLQRKKGEHQDGKHQKTMLDKYIRLDEITPMPKGRGIRFPVINFIANHCSVVATSDLPMESKDRLVKMTIEILKERYHHYLQFELQRAINLICQGHIRQGWEDDLKQLNKEEIDVRKFHHLDFAYAANLSQNLEYAVSIVPNFPQLHFARALLFNALGRNKEAQLALILQLEKIPNHKPSIDFLNSLTKKVA